MRRTLGLCLALVILLSCAPAAAWAEETPANAPRIELLGEAELDWLCGVPYEDPGFAAYGPDGEDRSAEVTVEGLPIVWRANDYTIQYRLPAEDGDVTAERVVHVIPQELPETIQPPSGTICLTFDDGPCENTERCLEILAAHNVKATFFIVADQTKYLDMLPKIVAAGHTLGIHCYDHDSYGMLYRDEEHYFGDFMKAQEIVHDYTGQYAHAVRFPGGSMTASFLAATLDGGYEELYALLHDMGVRPYDWNVQPESSTKTTEGTIMDFTHPRERYDYAIVLQHDARRFSVEALDKMLTWAEQEGYTFAPLDTTSPEILFN